MTVNWEISSIFNWVSAMFHLPLGGAMNSEKNPREAKPVHIYHI